MLTKTAETTDRVSRLEAVLEKVVPSTELHVKWLNTLSYMEHIGATKIATTQSGPRADYSVLKHTAEEARHGFYLKKLLRKIDPSACPDYSPAFLLAPVESRQYLFRLDIEISRILRKEGYSGHLLNRLAYLLVTWAIEVRADSLYPVYQNFLEDYPVKLSVRTIINEEEGHLEEMESEMDAFPDDLSALQQEAAAIEERLFHEWITALEKEI